MSTLCETFRKEAGTVWNRMWRACLHGMSLSEETLTECALYNIALAHQGNDIVVDLATKHREAMQGADWEWWLVSGTKGIGFRVQAKRLFPNGRYQSLFKKGTHPYRQLDTLIATSSDEGLIPLYCFFNFAHNQGRFEKLTNSCNHSYRGPSIWGCSLALPRDVRNSNSDQFRNLKPIMTPWHLLVCQSAKTDLVSAARLFLEKFVQGDYPTLPRDLPDRVRRLIEVGDQRRSSKYLSYSDRDFAGEISEDESGQRPEKVSGIVVFRDLHRP